MVSTEPFTGDGRSSTFPCGVPPSNACTTAPRSSDASADARVTVAPTAGTTRPTAPRDAYVAGANIGTTRTATAGAAAAPVGLALSSPVRQTAETTMSRVPFKEQDFR